MGSKVKPIEEVLADTLERIATALEELVELERTQPLEKIIHPSVRRPVISAADMELTPAQRDLFPINAALEDKEKKE